MIADRFGSLCLIVVGLVLYLFDATKSYDLVWIAGIGLGVVAALMYYQINDRQIPRLLANPSRPEI